jgi:5-oxoprolinase (ATP-hydrolysing)
MGLADVRRCANLQAVEARCERRRRQPTWRLPTWRKGARGRKSGHRSRADRVPAHAHMKYDGTDTTLEIPIAGAATIIVADFERRYQQQYGFLMPGKALIIEAIAVEAIGRAESAADLMPQFAPRAGPLAPLKTNRVYTDGRFHDALVFERADLRPGDAIAGPAVIRERNATTVIEPGGARALTPRDHLIVERVEAAQRTHAIGTSADPILLEVFNNLFMAIAEQMGVTLANTAYSVNIKERLDFSCAIFDADCNLIANAPHMPVHLGSMGESVKTIIDRRSETMQRGDVFVLNAPYNGGTHLPDVTVIAGITQPSPREGPVTEGISPRERGEPLGVPSSSGVARPSRRHRRHYTGSMPPDSKHVDRRACCSTTTGRRRPLPRPEMRAILASTIPISQHRSESGRPAGAGRHAPGAEELAKMVAHFGLPVVRAYMHHVQDNAEEAVRRVLDVLKDGHFEYEMDSGARIAVTIAIDKTRREATIDFSGTSAQQPTNFNAPSAVCKAAVLYVFRTLVDDEIPMNAGCLKPLRIVIPEGSMLNPRYPAAVVAGNVETSQTMTDALYGAPWGAGRFARDDEQLHVRQRHVPILRDDRGRVRRRPGFRRRQRGADAHDQFAAHRSGSARMALSRAAGIVRHPPWERWRRQA